MSRRFGIRGRLTTLVSVVFTAAMVLGAITVVSYVEDRLLANTRDNAETLLADYLESAADGGPLVAAVDPNEPGLFFYLDADGNQITEIQYLEVLAAMAPSGTDGNVSSSELHIGPSAQAPPPGDANGERSVSISISATPVGQIQEVDLSRESVAVAQKVRFIDGTEMYIGVANSLQPVTESITAIQTILWIVLPALAAGVGVLTYATVGRVLRPVHAITRQTRKISATSLAGRVPVPESRDDIAELATTMNDMLARLDRAQRRQRQFIADASHELRSPIAASQSQLEVALTHPASADWATTAKQVLHEQTQLGELVDDLLALTSLDEHGVGSVTDIDLGELIGQEIGRAHHSAINAGIEEEIHTIGNRAHLARAIRNIVDNADQHANSSVTVTLTREDGAPTIHVDDDGPGVPAEQRERIFERFTRLDEPRNRNDGGAGLGLAIVKQVMKAHGGYVECTDGPVGGARITLRFRRPSDPTP
jgi:signal transduction histidine kinase